MNPPVLTCEPIGTIRTPFKTKYGAPRQPSTADERSIGTISLRPGKNFEQALQDLEGFGYVWIISWFHQNTRWKPMVLPPNGGRTKRGVLATRSPHRPNPIGLSLCRLVSVKGRTLVVENPDMLDGSPILDIKPYLPHAESFPDAAAGWIAAVNEQSQPRFKVSFHPSTARGLERVEKEHGRELVTYVSGILARDPFPHSYRRIKQSKRGKSVLAAKRWRFHFIVSGGTVTVSRIVRTADKS